MGYAKGDPIWVWSHFLDRWVETTACRCDHITNRVYADGRWCLPSEVRPRSTLFDGATEDEIRILMGLVRAMRAQRLEHDYVSSLITRDIADADRRVERIEDAWHIALAIDALGKEGT